MARKVTKTTIYNNLDSFAAFIEGADSHVAIVDGVEHDATAAAMGAQAMALYVLALLDGEVPVDNDMGHLAETIIGVAMAGYLFGSEEVADDDE